MAGPRTLNTFRTLLGYPADDLLQAAELLYIILQSELPEAATEVSRFGAFLEQHRLEEVEEAYISAFEMNPACALEIGWQLFGEEYDRGLLLVRLRDELRRFGIRESTELPDHLSHVLPLIAAMPDDEAKRFVQACVMPAVQKMRESIERTESPYRFVVATLSMVLQSVWGDGRPLADGSLRGEATRVVREDGTAIPEGVDLLHAFPAADVQFGCGSSCHGGCGGHSDGGHSDGGHSEFEHHGSHRLEGAESLVQLSTVPGHREETR